MEAAGLDVARGSTFADVMRLPLAVLTVLGRFGGVAGLVLAAMLRGDTIVVRLGLSTLVAFVLGGAAAWSGVGPLLTAVYLVYGGVALALSARWFVSRAESRRVAPLQSLQRRAGRVAYFCTLIYGPSALVLMYAARDRELRGVLSVYLSPVLELMLVAALWFGFLSALIVGRRSVLALLALAPVMFLAVSGAGVATDEVGVVFVPSAVLVPAIGAYGIAAIAIGLRGLWRSREAS